MSRTHARDRFDSVQRSARVGAHRAPTRGGRGWIGFGVAAFATVVIVALGIWGLSRVSDGLNLDEVFIGSAEETTEPATGTPTEAPVVEPTVDPDALVTVLNGTSTSGLAGTAADALVAAGWTDGNITATNADTTDVETSVVYYEEESQAGVAAGVAQALGIEAVEIASDDDSNLDDGVVQITVVLGADYAAN